MEDPANLKQSIISQNLNTSTNKGRLSRKPDSRFIKLQQIEHELAEKEFLKYGLYAILVNLLFLPIQTSLLRPNLPLYENVNSYQFITEALLSCLSSYCNWFLLDS